MENRRETIYFVSDFIFFSTTKASDKYSNVLEALATHIRYLQKKSPSSFNLDERKWLKLAKQELQRRKRSRVALKFFIALPRKLININQLHKKLKAFLSKEFQVPHEFIGISFIINDHNPHAHVLIFPRKYDGKKLSLNKYDLRTFHKNFKTFWEKIGYKIKSKKRPEQKLPHFGEAIKELSPNISKRGIVLAKFKSNIKIKTKLLDKLERNNSIGFPIYWIIKTNNRYIFTYSWCDNLRSFISHLIKNVSSSQAVSELWIISDKECTDFLVFLKINKKLKRGGNPHERNC